MRDGGPICGRARSVGSIFPLGSAQWALLLVILIRLRFQPLENAVHMKGMITCAPDGRAIVAGKFAVGTEQTGESQRCRDVTSRQGHMSSRLPAHSGSRACACSQVHALVRIPRSRPARRRGARRRDKRGAAAASQQPRIALSGYLSHQHASNAFLQMEQSASMFHFHTPTACQRTYFSFMRTMREEEEERQTDRQTEDGGQGRRQMAKGRLDGCALRQPWRCLLLRCE